MKKIDFGGAFDPVKIMKSGQCFRWLEKENGAVSVIAAGHYIEMIKEGDTLSLSCTDEEWNAFWKEYFDAERNYIEIGELIQSSDDEHLKECYRVGKGIRILKQDLFETIISFMISQNNNIKRISRSIELISERVGIKVKGGYKFPGPGEVNPDMFSDPTLGLGYRAGYIKEMYEFVAANPDWLLYLKTLNYDEAVKELKSKKGIGPKVADCICLFGLGHVDAFPVDTHIKQLMSKYYCDKPLDMERYRGSLGIVQQYLFYYELEHPQVSAALTP